MTLLACCLPVPNASSILPSPAVWRPSDLSTQDILNKQSFTNYKLICFQPFGSGLALATSSCLLTLSPTSPQSSNQTDDPSGIQYQPHWRPIPTTLMTLPTTRPTANDQYQTNDRPGSCWSSFQHWPVNNLVNKFAPVFLLHCCPALIYSLSWLFTLIHVYKSSRVNILIGPATNISVHRKSPCKI